MQLVRCSWGAVSKSLARRCRTSRAGALAAAFGTLGGGLAQAQSLPILETADFGAVGDGSTNDTAAIQATIDAAAAAGGGVVEFACGQYRIGDPGPSRSCSGLHLRYARRPYRSGLRSQTLRKQQSRHRCRDEPGDILREDPHLEQRGHRFRRGLRARTQLEPGSDRGRLRVPQYARAAGPV